MKIVEYDARPDVMGWFFDHPLACTKIVARRSDGYVSYELAEDRRGGKTLALLDYRESTMVIYLFYRDLDLAKKLSKHFDSNRGSYQLRAEIDMPAAVSVQ